MEPNGPALIRVDRCDEESAQSVLEEIFSMVVKGRRRLKLVVHDFDECIDVVRRISSELLYVSLEVYEKG